MNMGAAKTRALHKAMRKHATPKTLVCASGNSNGVFFSQWPVRLISEANQRGHWRVHRARHAEHRAAGRLLMGSCRLDKTKIKQVVIVRCAPRRLDSDNCTGAAKAVRDGIADWIGRGDGPGCGIEWVVTQEVSPEYGVKVSVYE